MKVEFVYLIFFGLFGLAPFEIRIINLQKSHRLKFSIGHAKFSRSTIGFLYVVLLIILILGLSYMYFWTLHDTLVPNENSSTRKIRITMKLAGAVTIVVIWANYCWKHSKMVVTANNFTAINAKMLHVGEIDQSWKKYAILYILIILHLILSALNFYTTYVQFNSFDISMMTNLFDTVICLHILQYAIILGVIKIKFKDMCLKLLELLDDNNGTRRYVTFVTVKKETYNTTLLKVSTIRQGHAVLLDVCDNVSKLYGSSILFSLIYAFGIIVYYSYWASSRIVMSAFKSWLDTSDFVIPLICVVFAVTAVCILANDVIDQVQKFPDVINKLLDSRFFKREIKTELEIFFYEVSHQKIKIQACSLFSIDCRLLRSIFSVTSTYLILLLEMDSSQIFGTNQKKNSTL